LRRGLVPADLLRHCVEHGEMLGMLAHQLAPELKGSVFTVRLSVGN
jgi:hypothetical protein